MNDDSKNIGRGLLKPVFEMVPENFDILRMIQESTRSTDDEPNRTYTKVIAGKTYLVWEHIIGPYSTNRYDYILPESLANELVESFNNKGIPKYGELGQIHLQRRDDESIECHNTRFQEVREENAALKIEVIVIENKLYHGQTRQFLMVFGSPLESFKTMTDVRLSLRGRTQGQHYESIVTFDATSSLVFKL